MIILSSLVFAISLFLSTTMANAKDLCETDFRAISFDQWSQDLQKTLNSLEKSELIERWTAERCALSGFKGQNRLYLRYIADFYDPSQSALMAQTTRNRTAVVSAGDANRKPQEHLFTSVSASITKKFDIHPNFLHDPDGRTIFVGLAWISRSWKCYPEWPAATSPNKPKQDYCVVEPAADEEPFVVKFVAGGKGAPMFGTAMKISTSMQGKKDSLSHWYTNEYLPKALDIKAFEKLMTDFVVVSNSEKRSTRKVRFVFVDRSGNEGPVSSPDDPLPARHKSTTENSGDTDQKDANICGSASSACPMMHVPGHLIEELRLGQIDFRRFDSGFFE